MTADSRPAHRGYPTIKHALRALLDPWDLARLLADGPQGQAYLMRGKTFHDEPGTPADTWLEVWSKSEGVSFRVKGAPAGRFDTVTWADVHVYLDRVGRAARAELIAAYGPWHAKPQVPRTVAEQAASTDRDARLYAAAVACWRDLDR